LRDRGLVAPGYLGDLLLLDDLEACTVATVIRRGRMVTGDVFAAPGSGPGMPVIGIIPGKIITDREHADCRTATVSGTPSRDAIC